jgi:hypothetical protein
MSGSYPLQRLIMRGHGDKPLSQVRIRHSCGTVVSFVRIAPLFDPPPKS